MKTVTQNLTLCYTYNTKRCKSFEQNRRRIRSYVKDNYKYEKACSPFIWNFKNL